MFINRRKDFQDEPEEINQPLDPETREVTTYEELTIKVLDILERDGINIYDENRHGGMYLKTKHSNAEKIFQSVISEKNNQTIQPSENKKQTSQDIINFFKNGKKEKH